MNPIGPSTTHYQFAQEMFNRRVVDERAVMLGQDSLRPDPITMTLRRGVAAIGRFFQRDQGTAPDVAIVPPAANEPVRLPDRDVHDRAA